MSFMPPGAKLPPAPKPTPPNRPSNALHEASNAVATVVGAPMVAVDAVNMGIANVTGALSAPMPAATLGSIAFGAPHAHIAHPPGLIPPSPTVNPTPPIGPVTLGCCVQVLINGKPAARAGDIGMSPTCFGIIGMYEVKTGSSTVFIGGARAARMTDFSHHCTPAPDMASRGQKAAQAATKAAKMAAAASKVVTVATKAMLVGGVAAQGMAIAGDTVEAVKTDNASMSSALALNAGMMSAQMAMDAAAMAAAAAMGKDQPMVPPTGTLGTVLANTSPNVTIGGIPVPPLISVAKGFMKLSKGLRRRLRSRKGKKSGPGPKL